MRTVPISKETCAPEYMCILCLLFSTCGTSHTTEMVNSVLGSKTDLEGTFQQDQVKNLRNVAIPGTGIPLSLFTKWKLTTYFFLLVVYPLVSLVSALYINLKSMTGIAGISKTYREQLVRRIKNSSTTNS
jgi:hypothetical protein